MNTSRLVTRILAKVHTCVYNEHMNEPRMLSTGLKNVLEAQGRKKRWLAQEAGLSESYLGRVIKRYRTISKADATKVSAALGIPLFLLFEFTEVSNKDTDEQEAIAS